MPETEEEKVRYNVAIHSLHRNIAFCGVSMYWIGAENVPSHFASSSEVIRSSLGGSSWTGTLGAKRPESVPVIVTSGDIGSGVG